MQFIDLKAQQQQIRTQIDERIKAVLDHGKYIMGPEVFELEEQLADFVGVQHCICVSSGTDALLIALMACGIGHADEVITTPFTFIATAEVISLLGATPVFVDIEQDTYCLDPGKIESAITPRTKAIIPVSIFGQCADIDTINDIAKKYDLTVIEDGAQSFGATYKGSRSCGLSDIGCTSFFPSKPLGCYGDGGACFTNDSRLAEKIREIRVHGQDRRYHHTSIGVNGRLDTIQAAILLEKLELFPAEIERRVKIGTRYTELLSDYVQTPEIRPYNSSVYAQFTIEVNDRGAVQNKLQQQGIPTAIHYPISLNRQPAFKSIIREDNSYPRAEIAAGRVLSLPMHPYLADEELERIADVVIKVAC